MNILKRKMLKVRYFQTKALRTHFFIKSAWQILLKRCGVEREIRSL